MNFKNILSSIQSSNEKYRQLLVPILLSVLGTVLLLLGVQKYKKDLGYGMEKTPILVASRSLQEGESITSSDLTVQSIPKKYAPLGVLLISDQKHIKGKLVKKPIPAGAMITWSDLDVGLSRSVPARRIAKGYRALSIAVDHTASVANAVRPGDHVDIVTTTKMLSEEGPKAVTLLQNVSVLDVGRVGQKGHAYSTVTLMVLPKEVGLISFAGDQEKLRLVLRHPDDYETLQDLPLVGQSEVLEAAFRNSVQEERNQAIEIIRGGKLTFHRSSH